MAAEYDHVFWQSVKARFATGGCFAILAALVVGVNLYFAGKFTRFALEVGGAPTEGGIPIEGLLKRRRGYVIATAVLVFIMGNIGAGQWPLVWRYLHSQSFGVLDPIFSRDVGFYVFALPFYQFVVNFLIGAVIVSAIVVGLT